MSSIYWPVLALVALTACVWLLMYYRRISEISARHIDPQTLATSDKATSALNNVAAADNFRNLLEAPVLFYVLCLALSVTATASPLQITLAWAYFWLRAVHSLIHVTYNRVMHRFIVYVASMFCLFTMWGFFAVSLFAQHGR